MYREELMQQKEQRQDPLHTLGRRKRQTHYMTDLINDAHQKTYQNALTTY